MFFVMLLFSNYIILRIIIAWVFLTSEFAGLTMGPVGEKRQFWVYKRQFGIVSAELCWIFAATAISLVLMGGDQWVQTVDDGLYASAVVIFGELENVMYLYVLCGEFSSNVASGGSFWSSSSVESLSSDGQ